ncbi:G-type lectin S-receptor-like serine/threonine-protein kinase LECRK3 [Aristolochia californica]|uniref:G-type lectin S-receptor-like serine/threonine-protein kinase LECRK3 n=1 Tax=Aristolochia californica TaxID=171875 RepID=UPI0035DCA47A
MNPWISSLKFQAMVSSLLFSALLLLFLSLSANAQPYRNVSLSTSIYAGHQNSSWVSPSGDFAVGFRQLDGSSNLFLLAVWFDKIPDKTVVWSANGVNPVQRGSKFELASSGSLQLSDHQGREVWRRDPANGSAEYAAILDTGNFVLVNSGSDYAWESFAEPTDTLLPTQAFGRGSELTSRRAASEANFSTGRFKLKLQRDGNLALHPISYQDQTYDGLWYTNTADSGLQLVLPRSGYFYLLLINGSRLNFSDSPSPGNVYQRATLGFDGVFRQFVHPKASTNNGGLPWLWTTVLSHPGDICMSNRLDKGSGVCGFNSYCSIDNNESPSCLCPSGYSYLDPDDRFSGCKQDFVSQSCVSDGPNKGLLSDFKMVEMPNVDWPLSDYEHYISVDEGLCRQACLSDCRCGVAIFREGECWKKKLPLSNGRMKGEIGGKALLKVGKINSTSLLLPNSGKTKTMDIISRVLLGCSGALFLLSATLLCVFLFVRKKPENLSPKSDPCGANLMNFTYREVEEMTTGFSQVLGDGASGTVYKGVLSTSSSTKFVAVKKLDKLPKEKDREFQNELKSIAKVHHQNLVPLLGFCHEGPHRLLVYEFMSNGSLANFLFADSKPSWNQRTHIAFGIGRGLLYLHEECQNQIIHCDIKPQNVLLDDIFMARISDFGLVKLLNANQTRTTTNIRGTRGYVAPEWFKSTPITVKVDVYSFGVLLLEIICCRRNVEHEMESEEAAILTYWAFDCYKEGRLDALVEDDREALNDAKRLERLLMVAMWCIQEEPSLRPTMRKVTQMLEGAVDVPLPPDPSSFLSSLA